ncbi:MAG: DUF1292 domain-containing protein [Clostridia bacterium]|nr:DUF1292 domain-containing protein [Clostridia bacterium]
MADLNKEEMEDIEPEEGGVYTLTDVETGEEEEFELLGQAELDGNTYMAFIPVNNEKEEYVILKAVPGEDGETDLVDIEDDEEFDRVADYFEDEYFSEIDYDAEEEDSKEEK